MRARQFVARFREKDEIDASSQHLCCAEFDLQYQVGKHMRKDLVKVVSDAEADILLVAGELLKYYSEWVGIC
ncbi:hypothetical protein 18India_43 [Salmonella phage 18-India]|nr:hypothetical protein 18India_43 [Salmonella phage 18-India]